MPHLLLGHIFLDFGNPKLTLTKQTVGKTFPPGNDNNKARDWQCGQTLNFYFQLYTTMLVCNLTNFCYISGSSNRHEA